MTVRMWARRWMRVYRRAPAAPDIIVGAYYFQAMSQDFDASPMPNSSRPWRTSKIGRETISVRETPQQ